MSTPKPAGGRTAADISNADPTPEDLYNAEYYRNYLERSIPYERNARWLTFFRGIADQIVQHIAPKTVMDAGCALGILVETLRDRAVEAEGIDASPFAISHVYEPMRAHCRLASVTDELPGRYDLITCIEVLEHLPPADADRAIANLCRHTDDVLFSSTPSHFTETTHLNVQPGEYWARRFAEHGFYRDLDFDASFITPWAVRFRRSRDPFPRIAADYERTMARLWQERSELRTLVQELRRDSTAAHARLETLERAHEDLKRAQHASDLRLASVDGELATSRATIANMERSLFWRARRMWVSIRRLFGGTG